MEKGAAIVVKPGTVSLDDLARVLEGHSVLLDPAFWPHVDAAAEIVARAARADAPVYGINTGFGKLASKRIPPDQTALLQRNLIVSHCCGVGAATPEPIVRLMMALKIISLGRGASGVRREVIEQLQAMLARRVSPLVPQQGSVGASGDLAPLAHMTAVMIGEGQAFVDGKSVSGSEALAAAGVAPLTLGPKEGLALINGTQFSTAYAVSGVLRAFRPGPRRARYRRAVGRRGDGLDGAVPSRNPGAARPFGTDRGRGNLDGAARRQRHPPVASRRRRARAGPLLPALPAAGRRRGARPDPAGGADADYRGQCRHR
ncbi:hypothetical protein ACVWXM_006415 [Bradyrhizobium sp. GM7.3]